MNIVRVRVFQRDLVCSRGFLKFLCSCKGFWGVLQRFRWFQYLLIWLVLMFRVIMFLTDLVCSRGFLKFLFSCKGL